GKTLSSWSTDSMFVVDEDITSALKTSTPDSSGLAALCTRIRPARQGRVVNMFTPRARRLYCCHAERGPHHLRHRSELMSIPILPVYVSSTWLDLRAERKAVEQAVQRLRETKFV